MSKKLKYRPSIYLKAAKLIETGKCGLCCYALVDVFSTTKENDFFRSKYGIPDKGIWFGLPSNKANQRKRINALKRMAKLAEKENKK